MIVVARPNQERRMHGGSLEVEPQCERDGVRQVTANSLSQSQTRALGVRLTRAWSCENAARTLQEVQGFVNAISREAKLESIKEILHLTLQTLDTLIGLLFRVIMSW